jgi:hypothetical protein
MSYEIVHSEMKWGKDDLLFTIDGAPCDFTSNHVRSGTVLRPGSYDVTINAKLHDHLKKFIQGALTKHEYPHPMSGLESFEINIDDEHGDVRITRQEGVSCEVYIHKDSLDIEVLLNQPADQSRVHRSLGPTLVCQVLLDTDVMVTTQKIDYTDTVIDGAIEYEADDLAAGHIPNGSYWDIKYDSDFMEALHDTVKAGLVALDIDQELDQVEVVSLSSGYSGHACIPDGLLCVVIFGEDGPTCFMSTDSSRKMFPFDDDTIDIPVHLVVNVELAPHKSSVHGLSSQVLINYAGDVCDVKYPRKLWPFTLCADPMLNVFERGIHTDIKCDPDFMVEVKQWVTESIPKTKRVVSIEERCLAAGGIDTKRVNCVCDDVFCAVLFNDAGMVGTLMLGVEPGKLTDLDTIERPAIIFAVTLADAEEPVLMEDSDDEEEPGSDFPEPALPPGADSDSDSDAENDEFVFVHLTDEPLSSIAHPELVTHLTIERKTKRFSREDYKIAQCMESLIYAAFIDVEYLRDDFVANLLTLERGIFVDCPDFSGIGLSDLQHCDDVSIANCDCVNTE